MSTKTAHLKLDNGTAIDLPVLEPTIGTPVIDIATLGNNGYFTYDPGFMSTAACESKITYIDGDQGVLLYRGYPIEQLAEKSNFLEVSYLLYHGELPNQAQRKDFQTSINEHTMLHDQISRFYTGFRRDAHPMAILIGVVGALSSFYHGTLDISNQADRDLNAYRLIAKIPTIAAMCYKYSIGQPFMFPRNHYGYAENFMHMMFGVPTIDADPNPVLSKAMDKIFILHADHEQNASTSTVRLAGSSGANPYACIAAGIAALWGPAHGGANEACLAMLKEIGSVDKIGEYIKKAKDKNDPFRLMGFGHRVYKNYDPRAKVMRETTHQVLEETGRHDDPLLQIALKLEKIALEDDYFIEKKLYPNVDFYSGITFQALGVPINMFTVMFALARTVGWISHWNEMLSHPYKIGRPRQLYTGAVKRDYKS